MRTEPAIYVACLASYNDGELHGQWIDAETVDEMNDDIEQMLKNSPIPGAEEYAIHDHDGFEGIEISEHESLETVVSIAGYLEQHGPAFADYYEHLGRDLDGAAETFADAYIGQFDSLEAYAQEQFEELYGEIDLPGFRIEVDLIAWECDYWISGTGHVFRSI